MASRRDRILADPALAQLVRDGVLTLPTSDSTDPPPRKPVMSFEQLMQDLQQDREDPWEVR